MARTTCPDCRSRIRDKAQPCPYCGRQADTAFAPAEAYTQRPLAEARRSFATAPDDRPARAYERTVRTDLEPGRPWTRAFARLVDALVISLALSTIFIVFGADDQPGGRAEQLRTLFSFFLWIPLEAACLSRWGRTPGKALVGMTVSDADGELLSYSDALNRSVRVWIFGLAGGLPIVSLFTMYSGYKRLTGTRTTLWDEHLDVVVTHR